jgi:NADPH:quinone reductase-like Zn-dependent oxidoreductase
VAVGLNPVDYKLAASGLPSWKYPFILGVDIAGTVDALGEGVTDWEVGDPIYYLGDLTRPGGYGQYTLAKSHIISWLPEGLDYVQAAALPCAGFTAYQAIHRKIHIKAGKTLLVHGGAGGVGGFAVQLGRAAGLRVIATCSSHNANFVKDLGAAEVIDYNRDNVKDKVLNLTKGRGADYVIDTVGPESATASIDMLAFNGELVCIAGLPDLAEVEQFQKGFSIHEVALGAAYFCEDQTAEEDLARIGRELGALVSKGQVRSMVGDVITLEEIPEALERLAMRHVRGKLVAKIV